MEPQKGEHKLSGRINPAERVKIVAEDFDTSCEAGEPPHR